MKKFNELSKEKVNVVEKRILDSWKKNDIFNKTIENRKKNIFYLHFKSLSVIICLLWFYVIRRCKNGSN